MIRKKIGNRKVERKKSRDEGARSHRCTEYANFKSWSISFEHPLERNITIEEAINVIHAMIEAKVKISQKGAPLPRVVA